MNLQSDLYRAQSRYNWLRAAYRGPGALLRRAVRVAAYRTLTSILRRSGL